MFGLFLFACSNENPEQKTEKLNTIEDIVSEMKILASKQNKVVQYEVTYTDGMYKSKLIKMVDVFEYNFKEGYSYRKTSGSGGVTVECSDGTVTRCSGEREGSCVGAAVKRCLNGGGCANVCPTKLTVTP